MRFPVLVAALAALVVLPAAPVVSPVSAGPSAENPWPYRRVLNIAHRGGLREAPESTLYAYHRALANGAHMLEMDTYATADGEVVVMHDATVNRTTNGSGRVDELTLAEIRELDAAYWFVPGVGATRNADESQYVYRGVATGDREAPEGFTAADFRVPTLKEVLDAFPGVLMTIEIKSGVPHTAPYHERIAELLADAGRTTDTIVVSFEDQHTEAFKLVAPEVSTATPTATTAVFWASARGPLPGAPNPRYHAMQVPIDFLGIEVIDPDGEFVRKAHTNGFAVHVWTINDRATMERLLDLGVDGIMTDRPSLLAQALRERAG